MGTDTNCHHTGMLPCILSLVIPIATAYRDVVDELKRRSTLCGLVLLALRTPAKFMLPWALFAYTLRTGLNIVDLVVNIYQPLMPPLIDCTIKQVRAFSHSGRFGVQGWGLRKGKPCSREVLEQATFAQCLGMFGK